MDLSRIVLDVGAGATIWFVGKWTVAKWKSFIDSFKRFDGISILFNFFMIIFGLVAVIIAATWLILPIIGYFLMGGVDRKR